MVSKKVVVAQREAGATGAAGQQPGLQVHPPGDAAQPLRSVPDRVHAGHDGQQHLRGADVGGGLLAADVLLAGLQGEPHGRRAGGIHADADEPARHVALVGIAGGHVAGVRAAEAHRHAEALRRADHDVGAQLAGRGQQHQRQQVGGDDGQRAEAACAAVDLGAVVAHRAGGAGILQQHAERLGRR